MNGQELSEGSDGEGSRMDGSEREFGEDGGPKRKKTKIRDSRNNESSDIFERKELYKVFISMTNEGESFADWGPVLLTRHVHKELGEVKSARKLRNGSLLVECVDEKQQLKAIKINKINGQKVKCVAARDKELIRGVITGISVDESVEELVKNITNVKIKEAKRLKMKRDGVLSDSLSVLLTFDEVKLPEKVFIGFMCYDVKVYIPPPLRCFKCQRYGHVANVCKGKTRCSKCGGEHSYGECEVGAKQKCCNCGGDHSAAYGGCEVYKRMREVQRIKVEQGMSYAEAVKLIPKPVNVPKKDNSRKEGECSACKTIQDDSLIVKKLDFVLFMADVINRAAQTSSRTDTIKIIVRAAKKFLNVQGLEASNVIDYLNEHEVNVVEELSESQSC